MTGIHKDKIKSLVQDHFRRLLSKSEEIAYLLPDDPVAADNIGNEISGLEEYETKLRTQALAQQYDAQLIHEAREALIGTGEPIPAAFSEPFLALCDGLLRAKIENARQLRARLAGDFAALGTVDPLFAGISSPGMPPLPGDGNSTQPNTLMQLIAKYVDIKTQTSAWVGKTLADNRRCLGWFEQIAGPNLPIQSLTQDHVRSFRDHLLILPANFIKQAKLKGKTFKEAAGSNKEKTQPSLSPKTAKKYLENVKAFLNWCEAEGYLAKAPTGKITIKLTENASEARHPFTSQQLTTLFNSPLFTGHQSAATRHLPGNLLLKDGKYWIPIVGLYSGMRLGEIVQLLVTDIKWAKETPYFDIALDEEGQKKLKTKAAKRKVPVHPALIEAGFMQYVDERRESDPNGRIFPDILPGKDGYYSHNYSKWFGRYLKLTKLKTPKITFHSFRHTFIDALRHADVEDARIKAIVGHTETSVTGAYGSSLPPDVLYHAICKASFELPTHLLAHAPEAQNSTKQ